MNEVEVDADAALSEEVFSPQVCSSCPVIKKETEQQKKAGLKAS